MCSAADEDPFPTSRLDMLAGQVQPSSTSQWFRLSYLALLTCLPKAKIWYPAGGRHELVLVLVLVLALALACPRQPANRFELVAWYLL